MGIGEESDGSIAIDTGLGFFQGRCASQALDEEFWGTEGREREVPLVNYKARGFFDCRTCDVAVYEEEIVRLVAGHFEYQFARARKITSGHPQLRRGRRQGTEVFY